MRTILAAALVSLAATPTALAYCPSYPDDASTGYVENQTALAVCRQLELNDRIRLQQQQAQFDARVQQFQHELKMERAFDNGFRNLPTF